MQVRTTETIIKPIIYSDPNLKNSIAGKINDVQVPQVCKAEDGSCNPESEKAQINIFNKAQIGSIYIVVWLEKIKEVDREIYREIYKKITKKQWKLISYR